MWQELVSGIAVGALYVLLALGFTVTLGIGDMVNLAYGSTVVAGMYTVFELNELGLSVYLAVVAAMVVCTVVSLVIYVLAIAPSRRAGTGHREQIVYTLVITSAMAIAFQLFFGGGLKGLPFTNEMALTFGGVSIDAARLVAFVVASAVTITFIVWLKFSMIGKLIAMTGKYTDSAYAIGVPVSRVFVGVFCIGGALAGLAGGLLMTILPVSPTLGLQFLIIALIVSIAGRLSFLGVGLVGLAYGIGQSVLNSHTSGSTASTIIFAAFLIVLSLDRVFSARIGRRRA